jgi:UDP-glucuronate decarboxylase
MARYRAEAQLMKKILITGGAGNVAGSLARRLVMNPDNDVTIVDNLSTGSKSKLPVEARGPWRFIKADVNEFNDISPIMTSGNFDYVFHYAAVVGVQRTLNNPLAVLKDIDGLRNILDLSKNTSVKRVFFSSSSEVYGEPVEVPQFEDTTPLNSKLPYAIVKNLGEAFLKSYEQEYGLPYTIFRFFNTYGPLQSEDFVVSKFIKLARNNQDITVNGDGLQSRTFCYITDNVDTIEKILEQNLFVNDVLNIGNDKVYTILELAKKVIDIVGSKSKIVHLPPLKEGDMMRRQPDISKMKSVLKRELISLEEGIEKTYKWSV